MKKILLISDSHRDQKIFLSIVEKHKDADLKIHAGDSCLNTDDPSLKDFIVVKGNHDLKTNFPEEIIEPPFYITHGHIVGVYISEENVLKKAKENQCKYVIHGHTHIPYFKKIDGVTVINPGSTMFNRGNYGFGTYAIMYLDENNDLVSLNFYHHKTHEEVSEMVLKDGEKTLAELRKLFNR